MRFTLRRAPLALVLLAACSGGGPGGGYFPMSQEEQEVIQDPGPAAVETEVQSLPFKHVVWDHRFSKEISRITLGSAHLYLETPDHKVVAVDRFTGEAKWEHHVDTDTPLEWPPVEASGVPEEIRALEVALVQKNRDIDTMLKTKGPGEETRKLQKERDQLRDNLVVAQFGDNTYFISAETLYCLVRTTGKMLWTKRLRTFVPSARPFAIRDYLFVPGADLSRVWALDVKSGKGSEAVFYKTSIGTHDKAITNQPVYYSPSLYFVSHDGRVYSYTANGTFRWAYETEDELRADPVLYPSSIPYTDERGQPQQYHVLSLFVGGFDHAFYAVDATSGGLLWKYETAGEIKTPAVAKDSTVYVKTEGGALFAFDALPMHRNKAGKVEAPRQPNPEWPWKRNGILRWKLPMGERFLVKGKETVYVLGPNREIFSMEEMAGQVRGRYPLSTLRLVVTNPIDDILYVASPAGYVYALRESKEKY